MNITTANHFTFDTHNSILLTGQSGSGKSEFVRRLIRKYESALSPKQFQYAVFDLKRVEFVSRDREEVVKEEYLLFDVVKEPDFEKLEELAGIAEERINNPSNPLLFIYIEECDMACRDQMRFDNAIMVISGNAKQANIKLIYSTSRVALDTVSKTLLSSFDLLLVGQLANKETADYLGVEFVKQMPEFGFLVHEQ